MGAPMIWVVLALGIEVPEMLFESRILRRYQEVIQQSLFGSFWKHDGCWFAGLNLFFCFFSTRNSGEIPLAFGPAVGKGYI